MSKDFIGINHGTGNIKIEGHALATQFMPVEIHLKEDGAIGDKPSFAFVLTSPGKITVIGQLSLEMWNEGLADIGYEMVKKTEEAKYTEQDLHEIVNDSICGPNRVKSPHSNACAEFVNEWIKTE